MSNLLALTLTTGSDGANATTGNTGATFVSATPPKVSTTRAVDGTRSLLFDTSSASSYLYWDHSSETMAIYDVWLWLDALPTSTLQLAYIATQSAGVNLADWRVQTSGKLQARNSFSSTWVSNTTLTPGKWWHLRFIPGSAAGRQRVLIFDGNATTPVEDTDDLPAGSRPVYNGGAWDRFHAGATANTTARFWLDRIYGDDATPTGPSVTPPTVDAGSDQVVADGAAASIDATVSGTTGTPAYAWSVLTGPSTSSGQFSATNTVDTTFTPAGGPGVYTLRLAVTDDSGVTTDTATVTVTALTADFAVVAVTASGWSVEGGAASALAAVTDSDNDTLLRSPANPSAALVKLFLGPGLKPAAGQAFTLPVRLTGPAGSSFVAKLYQHNDSTQVHANSSVDIDTGDAVSGESDMYDHVVSFSAADWASMPDGDWVTGPVVRIEVST